jgi:8-oxo-dGTP pyrophosphatase MutT (NUDIX family)
VEGCKPTGDRGGFEWTHAKGGRDSGESFEQAAIREVQEETGIRCRIVAPLGDFLGNESVCRYFLMEIEQVVGNPDWETKEVKWFSFDHARKQIEKTKSAGGRKRDLDALNAAEERWAARMKGA